MPFDSDFIACLKDVIGEERTALALDALSDEPSTSVRLNSVKSRGVTLPVLEGSVPVPWSGLGHILRERPVFTLHPLFHSGVYYVQESSAMFVGELFRRVLETVPHGDFIRVLDLCAAPGGKTTDLADSLRECFSDRFLLVANEVMRKRAAVLADNVARWGDPNVIVTNCDPKDFASFSGFFDIILADVPCSGEGMFRKDVESLESWSMDNVKLCASRQRRIIADVWPALKGGGTLIYSTCTFNRFENDDNVKWVCGSLGASLFRDMETPEGVIPTECGFSLVPGFVPGEGQYCSAMVKTSDEAPYKVKDSAVKVRRGAYEDFFDVPVRTVSHDGLLVAVPESILADVGLLLGKLNVMVSGVTVGSVKGKDFVPDEDLALCRYLSRSSFPSCGVDKATALAFLHKDQVVLPSDVDKGVVLLRYKDVPLGFVKNLGNRTNNMHPQSRRIRMEI